MLPRPTRTIQCSVAYLGNEWLWVEPRSVGFYHDREWHAVDATIRNDPFISALIQGEFKKELLGNSIVSDFNSSLGGVLSHY